MKISKKLTSFSLVAITLASLFSCADNQDIPIRIAKYKGDKTCAISYTYDDGLKEHYTLVVPQMEKRNIRGTFWINGLYVGQDSTRITWAELKEMAEAGHEISNHSWSHANFYYSTPEEIKREVGRNDSIILAETGIPSQTFCYPFNAYNDIALEIASEGRIGTRTKQYGIGTNSTSEELCYWVKNLLYHGDWGVAMIHGITYGYDAFPSDSVLWNHFDKVTAQSDLIWIGTFREVAAYIKERDCIALDIQKNGNALNIIPKLLIDKTLFTEPLTMVIDRGNIKNITVEQGGSKLPVQIFVDKVMFDFKPDGGVIKVTL
jgi:peptidoglycan/xylan/chitin deacetylase (PgdA/CDA1 family)